MEENISERSGFVRLALGTGLTACGIAHLAKESGNRGLGALFVAAGAMKVAEGIFLYCPTKAFINSNVKNAVSTTFDEYIDGDSIMQQFNQSYESRWGTGNSSNNSTSQSSNSGSSTMQNVASTASQVAQAVSNVAPSGTMANTASQVAKTVADTMSGNQSNQNNNQNNHQSGSNNSTKSGKSAMNPS
ncbi:hypothetical protein H9636_13290 [Ureibacillus sp. Re31]|uniref:DUF2892 domain-containing protein n=1 Tax=Ureibacillus galli TaxID=2762222 RepID=A0ABR8XEF5_9BACL|nr:hypothetical protein [Ureibacillus galli]MBD8027626.1 hypothetical protein [Ureibacillus galli]